MEREEHDQMILKGINPVAHKGELTRLFNIHKKEQEAKEDVS